MGKYPRRNRTTAQQTAITAKSQRDLVKAEAVAFYDVIHGLPLDAPGPTKKNGAIVVRGKRYRLCFELATLAWENFKTGARPKWDYGRNAIYRRYEAKLLEIGRLHLRALMATPKSAAAKPAAPVKIEAPRPVARPVAQSAHAKSETTCIVCENSYRGHTCPTCEKQERRQGKQYERADVLLADGKPHEWGDILEAARGHGNPLDDMDSEMLMSRLEGDVRFVWNGKSRSFRLAAAPTREAATDEVEPEIEPPDDPDDPWAGHEPDLDEDNTGTA